MHLPFFFARRMFCVYLNGAVNGTFGGSTAPVPVIYRPGFLKPRTGDILLPGWALFAGKQENMV